MSRRATASGGAAVAAGRRTSKSGGGGRRKNSSALDGGAMLANNQRGRGRLGADSGGSKQRRGEGGQGPGRNRSRRRSQDGPDDALDGIMETKGGGTRDGGTGRSGGASGGGAGGGGHSGAGPDKRLAATQIVHAMLKRLIRRKSAFFYTWKSSAQGNLASEARGLRERCMMAEERASRAEERARYMEGEISRLHDRHALEMNVRIEEINRAHQAAHEKIREDAEGELLAQKNRNMVLRKSSDASSSLAVLQARRLSVQATGAQTEIDVLKKKVLESINLRAQLATR